jgi:FkbM family methyltransferase
LNISPKVIIDAGANIGLASIYFANKFPEAKIIALEPEKSNFELLSENVKYYTNIIPIQNALWHKNEVIELVDPGIGKWGFMTKASASENPLKSEFCHKVNAITVDKIISDFDLGKVDILKIDIEGGEYSILTEENLDILKSIPKIVIECHLTNKIEKEKFRNFRDNILNKFEKYEIRSVDFIDIKWDLWNEHFIDYYFGIYLYIDNR